MEPLSDELLARIVALAADAIICIDMHQTITFFNDGASRIFGYAPEEIVGQPLRLLIPQRSMHTHRAHIAEFGRGPVVARTMGERSQISGVRKNGEEFPAEAAIAKMVGPEGPIYSVVLRDVTVQRLAEVRSRELLRDAEAAARARDEVLGLVSHDLRNPVNAVKMLAAAILRRGAHSDALPVPADVLEHASVMLQAANQMDALIQDLLDVTRLESGRLHLHRQSVDLREIVQRAVDVLSPLAAESTVAMRVNIDDTVPPLFLDPDRMLQVFSNLIGNAIKFSSAHSVVHVQATMQQHVVDVIVRDGGSGIPADELPFVFDRFWQSRRTNRSGAGLGLAIARGIVVAHGGAIRIESAVGVGTSVRVALPERASSYE